MIRNISCTTGLSDWEPVLKEWFQVLDSYAQRAEDSAYWWGETATVSTLNAAVWSCGAVALQEYATERESSTTPGRRSWGRADFWCHLRDKEYTVEAKQKPSLSSLKKTSSFNQSAKVQLDAASGQCQSNCRTETNSLAMVFMIPSLQNMPTEQGIREWAAVANQFTADLERERIANLQATYLNAPGRQSQFRTNKLWYPGVILLAKLIPPRARQAAK